MRRNPKSVFVIVVLHACFLVAAHAGLSISSESAHLLRDCRSWESELLPSEYLSPERLNRILSASRHSKEAVAYCLNLASPADSGANQVLEQLVGHQSSIVKGTASWSRFYQTIRPLPVGDQIEGMAARLSSADDQWEAVMIAKKLGDFPQSRRIGEILISHLQRLSVFITAPYFGPIPENMMKEPYLTAAAEFGFQLSRYGDADILERTQSLMIALFNTDDYPSPMMHTRPVSFLNVVSSGSNVTPREGLITASRLIHVMKDRLSQLDRCPGTRPEHIANEAGCSISQSCPPCGEWQNHGKFVSCVSHATNELKDEGYISGQEHGRIVSIAAQSDVGKPHYDGVGCENIDIDAYR